MLFRPSERKKTQTQATNRQADSNWGYKPDLPERAAAWLTAACLLAACPPAALSECQFNVSDSLWGTLIVQKACQRDCELARLNKKLRLTGQLTGVSSFASAALDTSHHIGDLATLKAAGNPAAPGIVGLIAGGSGVLSLTAGFFFNRHYNKQASKRQQAIEKQVESILQRLKDGENLTAIRSDLGELIGEQAALEVLQQWQPQTSLALSRSGTL